MNELERFKIIASDEKILFAVFADIDHQLPQRAKEKCELFLDVIAKEASLIYGTKVKEAYERSTDPHKRTRTAPLICKVIFNGENEKQEWRIICSCSFFRCGKFIYGFQRMIRYNEIRKLFFSLDEG